MKFTVLQKVLLFLACLAYVGFLILFIMEKQWGILACGILPGVFFLAILYLGARPEDEIVEEEAERRPRVHVDSLINQVSEARERAEHAEKELAGSKKQIVELEYEVRKLSEERDALLLGYQGGRQAGRWPDTAQKRAHSSDTMTQPERKEVLPEQEKVLPEQEEVLPEQEKMLPEQGELLPAREEVLSEQEEVLPEQEKVLPEQEKMLPEQEKMLPEQEKMLPEQEKMLSEQEEVLSEQEAELPEQEELLPEREEVLTEQESELPEQEEILPEQEKVLPEQEKVLPEQEEMLPEQQKLLPEQEKMLFGQEEALTKGKRTISVWKRKLKARKQMLHIGAEMAEAEDGVLSASPEAEFRTDLDDQPGKEGLSGKEGLALQEGLSEKEKLSKTEDLPGEKDQLPAAEETAPEIVEMTPASAGIVQEAGEASCGEKDEQLPAGMGGADTSLLPLEEGAGSEWIDLARAADSAVRRLAPLTRRAGINVRIVCTQDKVAVFANERMIDILFRNIIDNSIKYMKREGILQITISEMEGEAFIVCKDNGEGLSPEETVHIFELNYQGSNRVSGNGLGLAQARAIVEYYGGIVYARSSMDEGMGIYIHMPLEQQER